MLVVGEKEMAEGTVAVRFRDGRGQEVMTKEAFISYAKDKIDNFFVGI
jgi:threonyl-tRNA synthetase